MCRHTKYFCVLPPMLVPRDGLEDSSRRAFLEVTWRDACEWGSSKGINQVELFVALPRVRTSVVLVILLWHCVSCTFWLDDSSFMLVWTWAALGPSGRGKGPCKTRCGTGEAEVIGCSRRSMGAQGGGVDAQWSHPWGCPNAEWKARILTPHI